MRSCCLQTIRVIRGLLIVRHHSRSRSARLKLRAHLLDLRSLFFELRTENLNLFLLLRDPCLQLLYFAIEHGLALGTSANRSSALVPIGTDERCPQLASGRIDVHSGGVGGGNFCPGNAADVAGFVRSSAGSKPADGNHILIGGITGIADINIIAVFDLLGPSSRAKDDIVIACAILKRLISNGGV